MSERGGGTARIPAVAVERWSGVEGRPLVVAGPCSAESPAQLDRTARRLRGARVDYLRAGIWKARTRPDSFEGIGEPALAWLTRVGRDYGLKTATEVARADQVEAAIEAGVDLLWIGARTTGNPFSVQEIAGALRGCDVPVLIKNPISPDLGLWLGAFERISAAGIGATGAIHRGVTDTGSAPFRNAPHWEMAVELRRLLPELPILCDPSHICGRRDLIAGVAQRAMDLGLDGLMIEVHPDPDHAWSDADQQVTPERLTQILAELKVREPESRDATLAESLETLRARIDSVDAVLMRSLAERAGIVELIGQAKKDANVMPLQASRWRALLEDRMESARRLGLDPEYVKAIFDTIHMESIRRQSLIVSGEVEAGELEAGGAEARAVEALDHGEGTPDADASHEEEPAA
jgi:chorismate mutase